MLFTLTPVSLPLPARGSWAVLRTDEELLVGSFRCEQWSDLMKRRTGMKRALWYVVLGMVVLVLAGGCRWMNVSLTVLQTSDLHHHASGYGPFVDYTPLDVSDSDAVTGGYARLATLIRGIRAEQEARCIPTLVVDSGDFFMGTAYDLNVHDPLALRFFDLVGYDAVTLGNHEFDWSPGGLALLLANGATQGFGVPVVATNTVIPAGNALESCREAGIIVDRHIVEYPHGIKVGILGIMGMDADSKAPAAGEVTFEHGWPFIQAQVDELRNTEKVELVMVLSHGGINSDGTGDDAELAANVTGIDIIASGHYHTATGKAFVSGPSNTIVFSPGEYGEYLSRLDLTYNVLLRKVVDYRFSLIPVDDTVPGDPEIQALVEDQHSAIDGLIAAFGVNLDSPVSSTGFVLETAAFLESSLGNLAADAVRFAAGVFAPLNNGDPCDFSVVASGVIRDSLTPGATGQITFADVYNVLPLGISPDPSQATGYPLMSVYVRAADLRNICEAALSLARIIGSDYYLNFSGIEVQYDPRQAETLRGVTGVSLFEPGDLFCTGGAEPLDLDDPDALYHCVVDLYALQMMGAVTGAGLSITPLDASGDLITPDQYLDHRIDMSPAPGIQELKEWMALLFFLQGNFPDVIPDSLYGTGGEAMGRIEILN
jgi:5'-nucleotidase